MENKALSEAASLRRMIVAMWTCYIIAIFVYVRLGPLNVVSMCLLGAAGILLIVNAFLLVRWQIRYRAALLDSDQMRAKQSWNRALVLWVLMALLGIIPVLLHVLFPVNV